jgi:hypothetical protein
MTWNWLACNKAYHNPAAIPKVLETLLANEMRATALHKPSTARTRLGQLKASTNPWRVTYQAIEVAHGN